MSYEEVADKFRENAEFAGMSRQKADEIVELVRVLETLPSVDPITRLLITV